MTCRISRNDSSLRHKGAHSSPLVSSPVDAEVYAAAVAATVNGMLAMRAPIWFSALSRREAALAKTMAPSMPSTKLSGLASSLPTPVDELLGPPNASGIKLAGAFSDEPNVGIAEQSMAKKGSSVLLRAALSRWSTFLLIQESRGIQILEESERRIQTAHHATRSTQYQGKCGGVVEENDRCIEPRQCIVGESRSAQFDELRLSVAGDLAFLDQLVAASHFPDVTSGRDGAAIWLESI